MPAALVLGARRQRPLYGEARFANAQDDTIAQNIFTATLVVDQEAVRRPQVFGNKSIPGAHDLDVLAGNRIRLRKALIDSNAVAGIAANGDHSLRQWVVKRGPRGDETGFQIGRAGRRRPSQARAGGRRCMGKVGHGRCRHWLRCWTTPDDEEQQHGAQQHQTSRNVYYPLFPIAAQKIRRQ